MEVKEQWQRSLSEYLEKRDSLKGLVVLMIFAIRFVRPIKS